MNEPDDVMLADAYLMADKSRDPSSQNGAVLRNNKNQLRVSAYNQFYPGIPPEYDDRTKKLQGIEHAERDAIYMAARCGLQTLGATLYCPWIACRECARGIIGSGIYRVVCHKQRMDLTDLRWKEAVDEALGWLTAAGVIVDYYDGPIEHTRPILVSGRLWCPDRLQFLEGGLIRAVGS